MGLPVNNAAAVALLGFAVAAHFGVAVVVYRIADQAGLFGIFWAVLYFFTCPIGLILLLIALRTSSHATSSVAASKYRRIKSGHSMERDPGYMGYRDLRTALPMPSADFRDRNLQDLVIDSKWEEAEKHINEMIDLTNNDGDRRREEDYRKILIWIGTKRNPFQSEPAGR